MYSLLLVDDERLELETLRDYIAWEKLGFDRVYTARSGRDAYDKVLRLKPDVMITDIHMPVMNGIELARQMYADGCTTKVVFLTGYDEFEYAKAALQVEAVDYILKPFSFDKIRTAMDRVKELLHKEELLKKSVRVYGKRLLCKVIDNEGESGREACRQFLDICEWDKEEWFGLVTTKACPEDYIMEQVENSLSEVVYSIRGGGKKGTYYLVRYFVDFRESAERICARLEELGLHTCVIFYPEKLSVDQLYDAVRFLEELRERAFYVPGGNVISARQLEEQVKLLEGEEENREVSRRILGEMKELLHTQCLEKKADRLEVFLLEYFDKLNNNPRKCFYILEEMSFFLSEIYDACAARKKEARLPGKPELKAAVYQALNLEELRRFCLENGLEGIRRLGDRKAEESRKYEHVVSCVKQYVEAHYGDSICVEALASDIGLSPNYVRSLFKESEGTTINEWIVEFRMGKACALLMDRRLKVKEISRMVGYENNSYFCSVFARRFGVSPNEYRLEILG
ncbi:MAG: response regulator [Eisenbergiella massiliensis]|uniref:response regulator transcription factor n=1 Tax=Eisenbergiella massiliensis TaxID=1720294 RepID=UPI0023F43B85|nr:response regulator [Eisenbergiella massiliensis]MCI6707652.1 response regulator [Eisenbergiella massiliensis]